MKTKDIVITVILSLIVIVLYFVERNFDTEINYANKAYQIYLDGEVIGLIQEEQELYDLIDNEQQEIKDKYKVNNVYPPNAFKIVEVNTYNENYQTPQEIYNMIEQREDFTVKGYVITIKYDESYYLEGEEVPENYTINVLDKEVFQDALERYILAFVTEDEYDAYIGGSIEELTDIGEIIDNMYFEETLTIKEAYISANEKIYTDATELSQLLLFGPDAEMDSYVVQAGDNIESISNEYRLNPQEFLVANPNYRTENSMLRIGDTVNVTLIDPIITFVYSVYRIEENIIELDTKTIVDNTKDRNYREITTPGVDGIVLTHETYEVVNGEESQQVNFVYSETIREAVQEVVTVGKSYSSAIITGNWAWPTERPYRITSYYAYRWGKMHDGIDISGPGKGSAIYAIGDGTVVEAQVVGTHSRNDGTYAVIAHDNNIYSLYAHMDSLHVSVGDTVNRGDVIGTMGETGFATGVHLHISISIGWPYHGSYRFVNPLTYLR